jgi:hypothetical protein
LVGKPLSQVKMKLMVLQLISLWWKVFTLLFCLRETWTLEVNQPQDDNLRFSLWSLRKVMEIDVNGKKLKKFKKIWH